MAVFGREKLFTLEHFKNVFSDFFAQTTRTATRTINMADKLTIKGNKIAGVLSIYQMVEDVVELDLEMYPLLSLMATVIDTQGNTRPRIEGFVERVVPKMTASEFRRHFRVAPDIYRHLLDKFREDLTKIYRGGYVPISVEKQFLVFFMVCCKPRQSKGDSYGFWNRRVGSQRHN